MHTPNCRNTETPPPKLKCDEEWSVWGADTEAARSCPSIGLDETHAQQIMTPDTFQLLLQSDTTCVIARSSLRDTEMLIYIYIYLFMPSSLIYFLLRILSSRSIIPLHSFVCTEVMSSFMSEQHGRQSVWDDSSSSLCNYY
jgi:hypothetical protein